MESSMAPAPNSPVTFEVARPERQSRLTNFPFLGLMIRFVLVIPHLVILMFLGLVAGVIGFIAPFGILFTGNYPRGMFDFVVGSQRWSANVNAYMYHLRDEYPPFTMDAGKYAVNYGVAYPAGLNRLLNFPFYIGMFIKAILAIPHFIVIYFLYLVVSVTTLVAEFAILFTGSYPQGLHSFAVGVQRWNQRVSAYLSSLTDAYPPFSMS